MIDPGRAIFLSYAREDAAAARRVAEALRSGGLEVWFDESELRGGDVWDQQIRKQIKECTLFVPIISASTQARREGYFRLEWRLADQRTHLMGKSGAFLVPICIDETRDGDADVPDSFLAVQWTRLPGGQTSAAFCERVKGLLNRSAGNPSTGSGQALPASGLIERGQIDRATPAVAASTLPAQTPRRRWLVPGMVGAGALLALGLWQPWRNAAPAPASSSRSTSSPSKASDEVAHLRAKLIPDTWAKEDFEPFSAALDRIIAADDRNADAWALRSIINSLQVMRTYEASTKPLETGRAAANRALHLAPTSALAQLALGMHHSAMISRGGDPQAPRPYLRRAFAGLPRDALTRYADLSTAYIGFDFEQLELGAKAWLENDPKADFPAFLLGQAHLVRRDAGEASKRTAQVASERGISGMRAFVAAFEVHYYLYAELVAARATLDRIPSGARAAHRVLYARWLLAMAERRWDAALQELASTPEDVFFERDYHGPKALLAGLAHQAAGRAEAAGAQFREAERVVRALLASDSQNERLHAVLALTLACAGRAADARSELALVEPLAKQRPRSMYAGPLRMLLAHAHAVLGQIEPMVFWLREIFSGPSGPPLTPASLRIDPRFQGVIARPEVQKLLAEFAHLDAVKPAAASTADQKSIAVLAFENRSSEKDSEYFSDGISEELLNVLGRIPGLRVVGRTSAFAFKGKTATPQEIGRALNVAHLVEGTVQQIGGRARIFAKLIRAETGEQVWSDRYDTDAKDIFTAQDNIARDIAQKLELKLGGVARTTKTVNPEAHRLVLEARHFWNRRTEEGFVRAAQLFKSATEIEPRFAEAYAGLALVNIIQVNYRHWDGILDNQGLTQSGRTFAQKALALDPTSSDAYAALGYAYLLEGRLRESLATFDKAIQHNWNSAAIHAWRAEVLSNMGDIDRGLQEYEKSIELDPLSVATLGTYASELVRGRRYADAMKIGQRALALNADFMSIRGVLARAHLGLGRHKEAREMARSVLQDLEAKPRWGGDPAALWVLRECQSPQDVATYAEAVLAKYPEGTFMRGFILVALGRFEDALPNLATIPAIQARGLFYDPMWDPWRDDARFKEIFTRIGLADEYRTARKELDQMFRAQPARK